MSSPHKITAATVPATITPNGRRWYVYGHTTIGPDGKKSPIFPIREQITYWRTCTHIQTVLTAADGSNLVYGLALDFDYKDAEDRWKTKGKLDHERIKAFIDELYPTLGRYLCTWTRSTGGRGLGAILFFDPFILRHEKTSGVTFLAERVQRLMIRILNGHGFGCDENATGIVRMTPNWRNSRILLHKDEVTIRRVQRENEPHYALRHVYNELRRSKLLKPKTKKDELQAGERFAVKEKADQGLAQIYAHILDSEPETLTLSSSFDSLSRLSGLSIPTLRKYLLTAPWLKIERRYGEGLRLTLKPSSGLTERVYSEVKKVAPSRSFVMSSKEDWLLPEPEYVGINERNNFLWRRAVLLRNEGYPLSEALPLIRDESSRIPGAIESRNCRRFESIVSSIYRHHPQGPKLKRKIFPLEALTKSQSYVSRAEAPNTFIKATEERPNGDTVTKSVTKELAESQGYCPAPAVTTGLMSEQVDREAVGNIEANAVMVSTSPWQGGEGDLPPAISSDAEVLAWMRRVVPGLTCERTLKPSPEGTLLKMEAFKMGSGGGENGPENRKPFGTIREARAAVCRDRHPLDRFERALGRVLSRASDEEILEVLRMEHERLAQTKDRGLRYQPPLGRFKRLAEAWSFVSPTIRAEFLKGE